MQGFVGDIDALTVGNEDFRRVLYTARHSQLVVMALPPGGEIGMEAHDTLDQFIRVEQGDGEAVLDGVTHAIREGFAVIVPAGMNHNIVNTGRPGTARQGEHTGAMPGRNNGRHDEE